MKNLAENITQYFVSHNIISKKDEEIYLYGITLLLEGCLSILLCLFISLFLKTFWECIILFAIFIPIRAYGGGLHFNTYAACLSVTCITVISVILLSVNFQFNSKMLLLLIVVSLIAIGCLYPVEHPNRPINEEEKAVFKKKFIVIMSINICISIIIYFCHAFKWLTLFSFTYFVIAVSMVLGKFYSKFQKNK